MTSLSVMISKCLSSQYPICEGLVSQQTAMKYKEMLRKLGLFILGKRRVKETSLLSSAT